MEDKTGFVQALKATGSIDRLRPVGILRLIVSTDLQGDVSHWQPCICRGRGLAPRYPRLGRLVIYQSNPRPQATDPAKRVE